MRKIGEAVPRLYQLLDPECLADPYPLYRSLRQRAPVQWDPYLYAWVVTTYEEVATVLAQFSVDRTDTPEQLRRLGLPELMPLAQVMARQMLFRDPPEHTRLRSLASHAFTPGRVARLRGEIAQVIERLLDEMEERTEGDVDFIAALAEPLPAIVTAQMLGVSTADYRQLKQWSASFAEILGNFQLNPERSVQVLKSLDEMSRYFLNVIRSNDGREGLIRDLVEARDGQDRLSEDEVVANVIFTMLAGMETTTNLIGNGLLVLLRNPPELCKLRAEPRLLPSAIEELLRYDAPNQHTVRFAPEDSMLGGECIRKGQAVIAVIAAANRDPLRFADPDQLNIERKDNRHLSFGAGRHFCFGAPLARLEAQLTFEAVLSRYSRIELRPCTLAWRENLGLRGLVNLPVHMGRDVIQ